MKYFDLCKLSNDNEILLVGLTEDSFLSYLNSIEKRVLVKYVKNGLLIIDNLLAIGNSPNRFISLELKDGKVDLKSVKRISASEFIKQKSLQLLQKNYEYLTYTILTDTQRSNIENNIAF
ncbi:MAG: type II toxin-antitoxin system RnlB family antitoxin [Succinivibrio sp.]|nr:type II toxin-antitoxin system RnlB family antitoxin [Succinivibrio sp.]